MSMEPAPVARAKPRDVFDAETWARLRAVSNWRGLALVAHCWAVIGLALAASVVWPNPLVWIVAIMVIGTRQLGLAILMHEAAHNVLHPNHAINDGIGEWLCAAPVGASLSTYRDYHLAHHRYTQTPHDPDLGLSAPFPVTGASLRRKIIRDLTGQTFVKQRFGLLALKLKGAGAGSSGIVQGASAKVAPFLVTNIALFGLLVALGAPYAFLIWFVAMATWFPLATRIRNIAEHACVESSGDPYTHARTTRASLIERAFIAPYWVNFHAEHHLFMYLPCYRLPEAHRALRRHERAGRMTVSKGYLSALKSCLRPSTA
jgi:fatty acid desaturase